MAEGIEGESQTAELLDLTGFGLGPSHRYSRMRSGAAPFDSPTEDGQNILTKKEVEDERGTRS